MAWGVPSQSQGRAAASNKDQVKCKRQSCPGASPSTPPTKKKICPAGADREAAGHRCTAASPPASTEQQGAGRGWTPAELGQLWSQGSHLSSPPRSSATTAPSSPAAWNRCCCRRLGLTGQQVLVAAPTREQQGPCQGRVPERLGQVGHCPSQITEPLPTMPSGRGSVLSGKQPAGAPPSGEDHPGGPGGRRLSPRALQPGSPGWGGAEEVLNGRGSSGWGPHWILKAPDLG